MKWLSADSLVNLLSGLGTARDKATGGAFGHLAISDNEADALYLSSWLGRKIVEIVPEDMTREWRAWQAEDDQITAIEAEERRLGIRKAVNDAMTWARLRGGAAIVIGDGSSDPAQEFDPASVGKGGLKYLHVVTRIQIKAGDLETDVANPNYGLPRSYTISGESGEVRIHPSRVVRFIGVKRPPDGVLVANDGWGDPIVKPIYDAIRNASSATSALAALLQEAKVDVISIPGLAGALETEKGRELLLERFSAAGMGKSIVNTLILDTDEEYEQKTIAFTGLPDVHMRLLQEVAGAADIPVTRLLGQSPAGLNSTGESDLRNYYDMIASLQENDLRPAMEILDEALIRSALGARPDEIYWTFNPLWQLTEAEKAKINLDNANALDKHVASGLIPDEVLSKGLINKLTEDGTYPGMDQALKEFEEAGDLDEFWEGLTNPPEPDVDPATGLPVGQPAKKAQIENA